MRIKQDKRGVSNVIVFVLGLVIVTVIVSNVFLWNYQMNQLDWEKMHEDVKIVDVSCASSTNTLTAHSETTTIGGMTYYLLKDRAADGVATTLTIDSASTGRKLWGQFVYSLSGVNSIPAATWTFYYRVMRDASAPGAKLPTAHADVDVLIRKNDGTLRENIATNVANSPNFTAISLTWETVSASYSWLAYTVIDQTDLLEVDIYCEVTTAGLKSKGNVRIDDNTLTVADQTRITNVVFSLVSGAHFAFQNRGSLTCHLVSLWVIDSMEHRRYDINVFINSGETLSYFRADVRLPSGQYMVRVVTERGNIAVYSGS